MNTGELQIERRTLGEISILDCKGRIVVRREAEFLIDAATFAMERSRSIVLNFSDVTSIDSGGLGTLVYLKRLADTFLCELAICSANPRVSEMISLTGLHKVLPLYRTEDDALRAWLRALGKAPSNGRVPFRTAPGYSAA